MGRRGAGPGKSRETQARALRRKVDREINEHTEELARQLDEKAKEKKLLFFFDGMASLYPYSFRNQLLIREQRPYASSVRTRRAWAKLGRVIRRGEEPMFIWAPASSRGFPWQPVDVFDVSQTDGPLGAPKAVVEAAEHLPRVEAAAARLGVELAPDAAPFSSLADHGRVVVGRSMGGTVQVHSGLTHLERIAALVHEYAHELLHWRPSTPPPKDSRVREVEAEATSYVVLAALGLGRLPRSDPSWSYLRDQGAGKEHVLALLARISAASRAILQAVEGRTPRVRIPRMPKS